MRMKEKKDVGTKEMDSFETKGLMFKMKGERITEQIEEAEQE